MPYPYTATCALFISLIIIVMIGIPRLFGMFQKNTVTGKVLQFNRTSEGNLLLIIESSTQSGQYTFIAYPPLAGQLETYIFTQRLQQRSVVLTIEYDPKDGQTVVNFSAITS